MGRLSTHILDTKNGKPASGVKVELKTALGDLIVTRITNKDGRTDEPLMSGDQFKTGSYVLYFHIGDYFNTNGFLDIVPIAFTMKDENYHVPLVCTPFSYSTYRGS